MALDILLGLQWGDEGKGKIVDYLAPQYHIIVRFQGGPNAGHTIVFGGKKYVLHTIPSGIYHKHLINVIGNGVVIDAAILHQECLTVENNGVNLKKQLYLSKKAHFILPTHRLLDRVSEVKRGSSKIGSTLKGISPAYIDKIGRNGLRIGDMHHPDFLKKYKILKEKHLALAASVSVDFDLEAEEKKWMEGIAYLKQLTTIDSEYWLNQQLLEGKIILAEGAQGTMLDIDFGTYPYVTSSNTISAGVSSGTGIAANKIRRVIGISKAYCTRVGSGPFPTELDDDIGEQLRKEGNEYGSTTGRPRRCGWMDMIALKYACMINGVTHLVITKTDVLNNFDTIKIGVGYIQNDKEFNYLPYDIVTDAATPIYKEYKGWNRSLINCNSFDQLPLELNIFLSIIEKELEVPILAVSTGMEREQLIMKEW